MAWKQIGQKSLADHLVIEHDSLKALNDLHALIDWSQIESILKTVHNGRKGERAFHPVVMFKVFLDFNYRSENNNSSTE